MHRPFINTPPGGYKLQHVRLHVGPLSKALSVPSIEVPRNMPPTVFILRGIEYQSDSLHRVPETTYRPNGRWSPVNINLGKHLAAGFIVSSGPSCLLSLFLKRTGPRTRDECASNPFRPAETFGPQGLRRPCGARRHSPPSCRRSVIILSRVEGGSWQGRRFVVRLRCMMNKTCRAELQVQAKGWGVDGGIS